MTPAIQTRNAPQEADIRAALERICDSPAFRPAPRLTAFLRFVVEQVLAGDAAHLKGYTIAVEALGRSSDFDPQTDPIVRVEAGRLRRALDRYYDSASEPLRIELPRGSYVPVFYYRKSATEVASDCPARLPHLVAGLTTRAKQYAVHGWLMFAALAILGALELVFDLDRPLHATTKPMVNVAGGAPVTAARRRLRVGPLVYIAAPHAADGSATSTATTLHFMLLDALSRFDEIEVRSQLEPRVATNDISSKVPIPEDAQYVLAATERQLASGSTRVSFRLIDVAEGTPVWSRSFDKSELGDFAIVQQLAATLVQPYGVIQTREASKRVAGRIPDPRYACILDAFAAWPMYDSVKDEEARECLEREVAADPTFSAGWSALSTSYLREHLFGFGARGAEPALDRALSAAQRAVTVNPESARAHQALMDVHFTRGEFRQATAAGRAAVFLNPCDTYALGAFGMRLIFMGQVDEGLPMVHTFLDYRRVSAGRMSFALFLGHYLRGEYQTAAFHAAQITSRKLVLGALARTLAARALGEDAKAADEFTRLIAFNAAWRDNPRGELRRLLPAAAVGDRLADDLADVAVGALH